MFIYNITTNIEASVHNEWLQWMQEHHIPDMLGTGKFLNAKMSKVLVEEEMGGLTYSVQFTAVDRETLDKFRREDAPRLQNKGFKRFPNKFVSFDTEMEIVSEHSSENHPKPGVS